MKKVELKNAVANLAKVNFLSADEIISSFEKQIFTALVDYFKYVRQDEEDARHYVKDNYSERFIKNLARDCYYAKSELREMFRKSPAWNENLQALIINGNRTHKPKQGKHHKNSKKHFRTCKANKLL